MKINVPYFNLRTLFIWTVHVDTSAVLQVMNYMVTDVMTIKSNQTPSSQKYKCIQIKQC